MHEKSGSQIQFVDTFFIEAQSKVYRNHIEKILQSSNSKIPLYFSDVSRESHTKGNFTIKLLFYLTN